MTTHGNELKDYFAIVQGTTRQIFSSGQSLTSHSRIASRNPIFRKDRGPVAHLNEAGFYAERPTENNPLLLFSPPVSKSVFVRLLIIMHVPGRVL